MDQLKELENTFLEEYRASKLLLDENMNKSALILLSKSLFALLDYLILKKYNKLPKNHGERFRILQLKEPTIYEKLDLIWSTYTDSYTKPSTDESVNSFSDLIKGIIANENISEKIKKSIK